ncbi:hypothetical protein [Melissospora conviva]|uniref:hypothetical protein n=1 Tax=Melissospora conviva TaxID=3388432 RepID=UPI003C238C83
MTGDKNELLALLADSTREIAELTAAFNAALADAKRQQIARVVAARAANATWEEIGEKTNRRRQNAHRDFSPHIEETVTRTVRQKGQPEGE